jgi:hypothetical protein
MLTYQYEIIANQKQQEIEQNAKQAWKFEAKTNKSDFHRMAQMIKAFHEPTKSSYDQRTCEAC